MFRNGDKHHQGEKIVVHSRKFRNMDQLRKELSNVVKLTTGACRQVRSCIVACAHTTHNAYVCTCVACPRACLLACVCMKVFTPSGKIVRELDAIEDGGLYVAAGAERLNRPMSTSFRDMFLSIL